MAGVLRFPAIGSEKTLPIYLEPERDEDESAEDFEERLEEFRIRRGIEATVKLVNRETARGWAMKWSAAIARDQKRIGEATKNGEPVTQVTPEGLQEMTRLQREIVAAAIVRVSGVIYGETPLDTVTDSTQLIDMLDACELLTPVAAAVSRAQAPSPKQGEP